MTEMLASGPTRVIRGKKEVNGIGSLRNEVRRENSKVSPTGRNGKNIGQQTH